MHGEWIKHSVSIYQVLLFIHLVCLCLSCCLKSTVQSLLWHFECLGNKRPYDGEFFSFLLKRVLAKDKQKGKSIKLVVKSSKAKKCKGNVLKSGSLRSQEPTVCVTVISFHLFFTLTHPGGKKVKQLEDKDSINDDEDDDELCSVDSVCFDLEKENEDSSNMNVADVPSSTSKKRKRTKDTEPKTCKASKKNKTPKKGFTLYLNFFFMWLLIIVIQICPFCLLLVVHYGPKPTECLNIIISCIN